jgi:sugar/nucleoside kinase (ribokinase family)
MAKGLFIGRSTVDLMSYVDVFPEPDQKIKALDDFIGGGGTALNAAVAFSHLGGNASLFSSFGRKHLYKTIVLDELDKYSIKAVDVCDDDNYIIPLSNIISVKSTSSRLIVNASQNECTKVKKTENLLQNNFDILLIDQYEYSFVKEHYEVIKNFTGPIILDGGTWKEHSMEYLELSTLPIVSEEFIAGGYDDFSRICKKLEIKQWAMTLGVKGIRYFDNGKSGFIPAKKVNAVDTLGAGDIFHGAFCYYYSAGFEFKDALENANSVAGFSCEKVGTRAWMEK